MIGHKTRILTFSYTLFIILLLLSGFFTGFLSELVYFLAFALPIGISLFLSRGDGVEKTRYLTIDSMGVRRFLPLIFPTISATIVISYITSLIIFAITGKTNSVDLGDSFLLALVSHALVPALLEEAIFRYLPLRLIAPHSPRAAIIISAFFFSLAHHDLFTIPYALVAGVMLMVVDLATESVIPSVIIHFINNALSVSLFFVSYHPVLVMLVYGVIILLTVMSVYAIRAMRDEYEDVFYIITDKGEGMKFTAEMALFAVLTLAIAVMSLIS